MQRWWYAQPDEAELKRVLSSPSPAPGKVAYYAAAVVECSNTGSCEGERTLSNICNKNARLFKEEPEKCPRREELKINAQNKPEDYTPVHGAGRHRKDPAEVAEDQRRGGQHRLKAGQSPAKHHNKR